ncbi:hypothetical protein Tco_1462235 [Tanacetum coccineum]
MGDADINTLMMEQYLASTRENQVPSVVKPEIGNNFKFEIKGQFMRELRENTFFGNKNDDAHEHVERVLNIVSPRYLQGQKTLRISSRKPSSKGIVPPSKTVNQLEEIYNFKHEGDETLYQAWERYNDLLYKCLTHDLSSQQKVNIFYKGLDILICQMLDSQRLIPRTTTTENWKLKKNVHAIQVGCGLCGGTHLNKEWPLNEEVYGVEKVKYGKFRRSFPNNGRSGARYRVGLPGYYTYMDNRPPFEKNKQAH